MAMWPNTCRSCCDALQNFIALVPLALILGDVTEGEVMLLFMCSSPSAGSADESLLCASYVHADLALRFGNVIGG